MRPDVVNHDDVRVIQAAGAHLQRKTPQPVGIGGKGSGQNFDGHLTADAGIAGAIYLAHASSADELEDLVMTQMSADQPHRGHPAQNSNLILP